MLSIRNNYIVFIDCDHIAILFQIIFLVLMYWPLPCCITVLYVVDTYTKKKFYSVQRRDKE